MTLIVIRTVFQDTGIKLTQEEVQILLNELDSDGDGEINFRSGLNSCSYKLIIHKALFRTNVLLITARKFLSSLDHLSLKVK